MTVTIPHDIYVFGTQENSVCDKEWVENLRAAIKDYTEIDYKPVRDKHEIFHLHFRDTAECQSVF